ncbi:MAG: CdaR family protein [Actinobacteria bacterium]|nr:CdaR family protein [Actinomycetota bacterium]
MRINLGLAFLAIFLSTALWVLVVNDQNPDRTDTPDISIPVEVSRVPPGLVVMNTPEQVRFKIRAPKDRWSSLRASSFRASVDLSRAGPGIQAVPVVPEVSDPQIRVLEVIPSTVSLRLEELRERTVPVKVNLVGNVPFGYVYGTPKVDPQTVVVSGPTSLVQSVDVASVEVRLDGVTVETNNAFHPDPVDSTGTVVRNVRVQPQTVTVRVPVDQQVSYKQTAVRAAVTGKAATGFWIESISVEPSSVTVVGSPKVLAGIDYVDTAPLNVNGASGNVVQDVQVVMPQGVSLGQQKQTVRITVNVSSLQASQTVRVAPRIVNLDPKLQVIGAPAFLDVTLQGPSPVLQALKIDSVSAVLDLDGLAAGPQTVKPSLTVPAGINVAGVDPDTARLILSPAQTPTPTAAPATVTPAPSTPAPVHTPTVGTR